MIFSRRIYFTILLHITLILLTSGTGIWMIVTNTGIIIGCLLILCSLFQIGALTQQLNSFNRKIQLFFDAVQDEENMLHFPEQHIGKEEEKLHRSFNRINELLAKTKTENLKQEHFYHSLLEEVPNGILAWDSTGRIIVYNSAALSLLGCERLVYQHQLEQLLQNKERRQQLSISQNKMVLQGETITLLSIKDIGDELSDKESESWSKLTHVLTHEIMNTIAPIISLSQTLSSYSGMEEKAVRGLHIIQTQSERLMEFTESFRHLSYLPEPKKELFSLTDLLHNLGELLQTDFKANNILFSLSCNPSSIKMEGDKNQLSQVFLNLLKNAMQALEETTDATISIIVQQTNSLRIDITDNGSGIPNELQEKIFIPFFSTKSEGMGIGLSLCKQIIRHHGGHLSLKESRHGKTIFTIEFPISSLS